MKTNTLEVVSEKPVDVSRQTSFNIEDIFKYALEKGVSSESMKDLMGIRRELNAEAAKKAFDEAMAAFQAECPVIEKRKQVMNKDGRSLRYKYAPLDDIVVQVREFLQKHGFSYSITSPNHPSKVTAVCTLTHRAGHSRDSEFTVPIDPQAFMNEQQKYASALTFAKRYAFCNSLGILTGDEDTDGRLEREKHILPAVSTPDIAALKKTLWELTKPVHDGNKAALRIWLTDECNLDPEKTLEDLTAEELTSLTEAARKKLAK